MFDNAQIIANGGGINWTWYHAYNLNENGTYQVIESERFHNWNESQGANDHPKATHYLEHTYAPAAQWMLDDPHYPREWIAKINSSFEKQCRDLGFDPSDVSAVACLRSSDNQTKINIAIAEVQT